MVNNAAMVETALTLLLCGLLNGAEAETVHAFPNLGGERRVRVDCETETHVIELGLDTKRSSRDSIHQAMFAAILTGKTPMVLLIDTDGQEGRYEYEMRMVSQALGITYGTCQEAFLQRWAATAPFRRAERMPALGDLPSDVIAKKHCDLRFALETASL